MIPLEPRFDGHGTDGLESSFSMVIGSVGLLNRTSGLDPLPSRPSKNRH